MAKIIKADTASNSEKAIILSKEPNQGPREGRSRLDYIREVISKYENLPLQLWQREIINQLGLVEEGFLIRACPHSPEGTHWVADTLNIRYGSLGLITLSSTSRSELAILREYAIAIGRAILKPEVPDILWHLLIDSIIDAVNPYAMFGQRAAVEKLLDAGFTDEEMRNRGDLPGSKKKQYFDICYGSSSIKNRVNDLTLLESLREIFPSHLLSSFTREEKRNYHLLMDSKRSKASALVVDASKISKEPPREYIQTTNGILKLPDFQAFSTITERLFEARFPTHLNGESNE